MLAVLMIAKPSYALTPAEELTSALQEVIQPPLKSEPLEVDLKVTEYRIIDGHLADIQLEYSAKIPDIEVGGDLFTFHDGLSQSKMRKELDKKVILTSHNDIKVKDKRLLEGKPLKPIPKGEWENQFATLKESIDAKGGVSVDYKILKTNAKEEVEAFEMVVRPIGNSTTFQFDIRLNFTLGEGTFSCNVSLEKNSLSTTLLDPSSEKQLIGFLENIRQRDLATMMMAQSMIQIFKGYAGTSL